MQAEDLNKRLKTVEDGLKKERTAADAAE